MILSPDPHSKRPGIGVCGLQKDHNCQLSIAKGMGDVGETMTFNQTPEPEPDTQLHSYLSQSLNYFHNSKMSQKGRRTKYKTLLGIAKAFHIFCFREK